MSNIDTFVKENAKWLIGIVFLAGLAYGEVQNVRTIEERLTKKIKIISVLQKDILELKINQILIQQKIKICQTK